MNDELILTIVEVEEPEFGCEGRPDDIVFGTVTVKDSRNGIIKYSVEESLIYKSGIDDGMRLVLCDSIYYFISERKGRFIADNEIISAILP